VDYPTKLLPGLKLLTTNELALYQATILQRSNIWIEEIQLAASIILLGDSIFDNASYVVDQLCVTEQFRKITSDDIDISMLAVDGDYVDDVKRQLPRVPEQATHLFVSVGGNDALSHYRTLTADFQTSEELFEKWSSIQATFRAEYRDMLDQVLALNRSTAVCTIYDAVPGIEEFAITALSLFNDVIVKEAVRSGLPIVDLRHVCTEPEDYSHLSPIEPSFEGGAKIARALNRVVEEHDFSNGTTQIYR